MNADGLDEHGFVFPLELKNNKKREGAKRQSTEVQRKKHHRRSPKNRRVSVFTENFKGIANQQIQGFKIRVFPCSSVSLMVLVFLIKVSSNNF